MGWDYGNETRKELVARLTNGAIAHKSTNCARHLWVVHADKSLCLYLIDRANPEQCGYKAISESMGPYYYDCPLSLFDLATAMVDENWRSQVRAAAARKAEVFAPGDAVTVHGKPYTVVDKIKQSWRIRAPDGTIYKASKAHIRRASAGVTS